MVGQSTRHRPSIHTVSASCPTKRTASKRGRQSGVFWFRPKKRRPQDSAGGGGRLMLFTPQKARPESGGRGTDGSLKAVGTFYGKLEKDFKEPSSNGLQPTSEGVWCPRRKATGGIDRQSHERSAFCFCNFPHLRNLLRVAMGT